MHETPNEEAPKKHETMEEEIRPRRKRKTEEEATKEEETKEEEAMMKFFRELPEEVSKWRQRGDSHWQKKEAPPGPPQPAWAMDAMPPSCSATRAQKAPKEKETMEEETKEEASIEPPSSSSTRAHRPTPPPDVVTKNIRKTTRTSCVSYWCQNFTEKDECERCAACCDAQHFPQCTVHNNREDQCGNKKKFCRGIRPSGKYGFCKHNWCGICCVDPTCDFHEWRRQQKDNFTLCSIERESYAWPENPNVQ